MRPFLTVLVISATLAGCATEPSLPDEDPGDAVPGNVGSCGFAQFSQCVAWSADATELFAIESTGQSTFQLVAIDPATRTSRVIGPIEYPQLLDHAAGDPEAVYYSASVTGTSYTISRYDFSNGSARQLVQGSPSFVFSISPDGRRLAFHPAGTTLTTDSIVVIDIATGDRVASRSSYDARIGKFSPDGSALVVTLGLASTTSVWDIASGSLTPVPMPPSITFGILRSVGWDGEDLRGLFMPLVGLSAMKDVGFFNADTLVYAPLPFPDLIAWVPSASSVFATRATSPCSSIEDCGMRHYDLQYANPTTTTLIGSINTRRFTTVVPSPDGKWLAYKVIDRPLYLIGR
jgi:WD40 repeat protein